MNIITTYDVKYLTNFLTRKLSVNNWNKLQALSHSIQVNVIENKMNSALFVSKHRISD
jgi:hypothetical protein